MMRRMRTNKLYWPRPRTDLCDNLGSSRKVFVDDLENSSLDLESASKIARSD